MTEPFIPAPTDAEFRETLVTVHHCMSRKNSVKVADFSFERTMPVWAAVQAAWVLGAQNWDEGEHPSVRVPRNTDDRMLSQQIWITVPDDAESVGGLVLDETSAIRFWTMVDQFGWEG